MVSLPENLQKSIKSLSNIYNTHYYNDSEEFKIFEKFLEKNFHLVKDNHNKINNLEHFVKQNDIYIKIYESQIPHEILSAKRKGYLYDINVHMSKSNIKKENIHRQNITVDDYVYQKFPNIQVNIPRGLTLCKIMKEKDHVDKNDTIEFYDICIYSNKKFKGISNQDEDNDEDDYREDQQQDNDDDNDYFIKNQIKDKVIAMEKINGDALHFSGRYINDKFYLFIGSKKSHIMINKESDIDLYTNDRFNVCKKFAKQVWKILYTKLTPEKRNILYDILHYTKITAICEILQSNYQHIVLIDNDNDLYEDKIIFLNFTLPFINDNNNIESNGDILKSLTAFPPHIAIKIMNVLGFTCATYKIFDINDNISLENIRLETNSEGKVLYYLNKENETIGMQKLKTIWYICLRALREKAKRFLTLIDKNKSINIENEIDKRYDEIQKWLQLTNDKTLHWKKIAKQFIQWLIIYRNENYTMASLNVASSFPILWDTFSKSNDIKLI